MSTPAWRAGPGELRTLSIAAQGRSLGQTSRRDTVDPLADPSGVDRSQATLLAGRVAEELAFGQASAVSIGALAEVEDIARRMVCEMRMSESLGVLAYPEEGSGWAHPGYSEQTARTTARRRGREGRT